MTLREYIIKYREDHGLSQRQFAINCDISNGYLAMIENNLNPRTGKPPVLSIAMFRKIASGMGMTLQSLIEAIDDEMVSSVDEAILTEDERDLIMYYRDLTVSKKHLLLSIVREFSK